MKKLKCKTYITINGRKTKKKKLFIRKIIKIIAVVVLIGVATLKMSVEKEILAASKTNLSLEAFRDNDSTVIYHYMDSIRKIYS